MSRRYVLLLLATALFAEPPKTKVVPVTETIHGVSITDPYRWLEDQNSPDTRAWIDAQAKYTEGKLAEVGGRDWVKKRLGELLKTDRTNAPTERGGRYFFSKRAADQDQSVIYMRRSLNGKDEVLIDGNTLSPDHTSSAVLMDVSEDGKLIAYGRRQGGEDETTIAFLDTDTHQELPDRFPRARYSGASIKPDKSGFYYSKFGAAGPRAYYHAMGSDPASDTEIFGKGYGPEYIVSLDLSRDGRYLTLVTFRGSSGDHTEIFLQDLEKKTPITPIVSGIDARFSSHIAGDRMYLVTNWNAPNSRVLLVDLNKPAKENWREIIPERSNALRGVFPVGGKLVANYLEDVHTSARIFDAGGKLIGDVTLPGIGTALGPFGNWESNDAFLTFTSFGQPQTIYHYDMASGKKDVWAQLKVPFDPATIEVNQVWYTSKDKTRVPMFLVHKKGLKLDRNRPVYLTGYGGFNLSEVPAYTANAVIWSELGGVYAVANLRGGGEFGEKWHKAGMFENKQNVFDDFTSAAEYLIEKGYTQTSKLAIEGGSNGGLLVGAALTQRPELYQAVICGAPLLDMVRYHMFKVAKFWVSEYGSSEDPKQFAYIYKYSPYQNVKAGTKYPAVMFVTGDSDTRVDPLHARKMAALLQASTASDRPILLHYDTKAGHSGGQPVNKQIDNAADQFAFLMWQLKIEPPKM